MLLLSLSKMKLKENNDYFFSEQKKIMIQTLDDAKMHDMNSFRTVTNTLYSNEIELAKTFDFA